MQHTYLRYECADAFSLSCSASATPSIPHSSSILSFLPNNNTNSLLLSPAGSQLIAYDLRRGLPLLKLGHSENLSGGVGTGNALNSTQVISIDVAPPTSTDETKVATGWVDGSVRVFSLPHAEVRIATSDPDGAGLVRSLLHRGPRPVHESLREALTLNGHASAVPVVVFERSSTAVRLASGSTDGTVILWDVVAETGLFRLLGHTGPVTGIVFLGGGEGGGSGSGMDGLVTSGSDGLVKVWDLNGQCCIQTLVGHRGSVGCLALSFLRSGSRIGGGGGGEEENEKSRMRIVTGCVDGQVRVWSVEKRDDPVGGKEEALSTATETADANDEKKDIASNSNEDICHYMGSLHPPSNLPTATTTNNEGIAAIHFHPNGRFVGICRSNDRVIEIYAARSELQAQKKRRRRLQRRREKQNAASNAEKGTTKKRGMLDDPESDDENNLTDKDKIKEIETSHDAIKASDEFEYRGTVRSTHKIRGFAFVPTPERGGGIRIVVALATNAFEVYSIPRPRPKDGGAPVIAEKVSTLDMYGHPTGIRSVALSSEDSMACTVSKNVIKIWNVANRSCLRSLTAAGSSSSNDSKAATSYYCLCAAFLPGNTHVILGTREGHLLIMDVASGDLVYTEENAHDGAIWSLDLHTGQNHDAISLVTGSADKLVKYWDVESQEEEDRQHHPMVVHARTLQMTDDVMCVRFSHSTDPTKRLLFVASLDSTIKVFFDDSLKFFLSLYGHKLPVLAFDSSDDDTILASGGADKSIKIWGLDFGDTHRTLYGHEDSITDLRFVKRTHNFFTCSKDKTVRFWDGDRFEQILLLNGHASEVCCLAVSRTGAFVLSGGMDRQVRVWERTKDIVFLDEEKERQLEELFDKVDGREENTADVLLSAKRDAEGGLNDDDEEVDKPQSEAAVKQSILSVSAGDRIMEAVEMADKESKEISQFKRLKEEKGSIKQRAPNPMLFGMEPPEYVLWVLRSVKSVDLEPSLLVLPLNHVERLIHYLILLLRAGKGIELCAKISVFLVKSHQAQIVSNRTMMTPLRELQTLVRLRTTEIRDTVGFNMAAMRSIAKFAKERKNKRIDYEEKSMKDIWAGLGLGA
ncbi:hypothetical protein HJC23_005170 [Cyclotella cryptica]|uniref:Small-subunit processome Utp12 domain-containing protein n=1 Tax=Cyclotella cryptica TaxID=29204 RepID=A0ABD3QHN2_9STRA|eukprot:CCRYP_005866-RA/>CCRYP_005866-RA protein AED:0.35 eAED:0.35 QI:106/1/1/1/0.5/0.33/3/1048/1089